MIDTVNGAVRDVPVFVTDANDLAVFDMEEAQRVIDALALNVVLNRWIPAGDFEAWRGFYADVGAEFVGRVINGDNYTVKIDQQE